MSIMNKVAIFGLVSGVAVQDSVWVELLSLHAVSDFFERIGHPIEPRGHLLQSPLNMGHAFVQSVDTWSLGAVAAILFSGPLGFTPLPLGFLTELA